MNNQIFALSLGLCAALAAALPTNAQQRNMCAQRDTVIGKLASDFGETRRSMGLAANNGIIEVHASETTGSWTITVTHPNGVTCLLAAGQSFEELEEELPTSLGAPT